MPLRIVGSVYLLSAIWCFFQPEMASQGLGIQWLASHGKVEFLSVYGGLQLGLAVAMLSVSFMPKLLLGGVFFSTVFSTVLAFCRLILVLTAPMHTMLLSLLVIELVIAAFLFWYWRRIRLG
ncbi:MAG: hypothetical protein HWE18_07570 [Gammaproteobacteria bacterium]|nr:hypothetical protein [Gammaproteobacteria bacterium]